MPRAGLFIVHDPPEVRCGEELLHHLIQGGERKTNRFVWRRRIGYRWGLTGGEPVFTDLVTEAWMDRIFNGALDIGGRHLSSDDGDQAPIEWMMWQHHIFLRIVVCDRLRFG